ncbi:MAG: hypothetical protein ACT4TC_16635 [Myxococcaceae bacterium]
MADKLRSFILNGIELGHVVRPTKRERATGDLRAPTEHELSHLVLTQIHEALRRDRRLNGGSNTRKNEKARVKDPVPAELQEALRVLRRTLRRGTVKEFQQGVRDIRKEYEEKARELDRAKARKLKTDFAALLRKHLTEGQKVDS